MAIEEAFVVYLDEDNKESKGYFSLIELKENCAIFETRNNSIIILPFSRIIKIKLHSKTVQQTAAPTKSVQKKEGFMQKGARVTENILEGLSNAVKI